MSNKLRCSCSSPPAMSHALIGRDRWGLQSNVWSSPEMSSALVGRDCCGSQIGLPAMSVPSWRDRHLPCRQIKINNKRVACLQCLMPLWHDRHLACFQLARLTSTPLLALTAVGLLFRGSSPNVSCHVGPDRRWLAHVDALASQLIK